MDWKQIVPTFLITAVFGIAGTFFLLQGRISNLEGRLAQISGDNKQLLQHEKTELKDFPSWPRSSDGKYEGVKVIENGEHFQIREIGTGRIIFTTHAQFETANNVKAGLFSPDSKKIAAAYHYSHEGQYTWVGIWDIESGNLIDTKKRAGWDTDIFWVF